MITETPEWMLQAACRGVDPDVFFPDDLKQAKVVGKALSICARCPVKDECLADALALPLFLDTGVRGGTTPGVRRGMRDRAKKASPTDRLKDTHGTTACYSAGCRCADCRGAHNARVQTWRAS